MPNEKLYARSASAEASEEEDCVVLKLSIEGNTVPVEVLLQPNVASVLATQMGSVARAVNYWRANQRFPTE
jgi:hypothetical protein